MKRYNMIIILAVLIYGAATVGLVQARRKDASTSGQLYKVEMNRIQDGFVKAGTFTEPVLHEYKYVKKVSYLDAQKTGSEEEVDEFYEGSYGFEKEIWPLYVEKGQEKILLGYIRYDYEKEVVQGHIFWTAQAGMLLLFSLVIAVLVYLKISLLIPFQRLKEMPYELANGHLKNSIPEIKTKYFGNFVWGINMLKDSLDMHRQKELRLEREKKMLLLSISHDIKTPLGAIKLYAKALFEDVYGSGKEKQEAARQIGEKANEIQRFVGDIVRSSTKDVVQMEVKMGEFYLRDLVCMIKEQYHEMCRLRHLEFAVGHYENRLIKGDIDRAVEVCENLMENALKYGDGRKIAMTFGEEDYCHLIHIRNTGDVVEMREILHLFDSFYRGMNSQGKSGNGLGLYICREIMRKMDGDIYAERKEDGMEFVLVFR